MRIHVKVLEWKKCPGSVSLGTISCSGLIVINVLVLWSGLFFLLLGYHDVSFSGLPHPPCHDRWNPLNCELNKSFFLLSFYVKHPVSMVGELVACAGHGGTATT